MVEGYKMQIDFHHTITYVCARMAGFEHDAADIIAYSAQYVDDATNAGIVKFNNGALYSRVSSAHTTFDMKHHMNRLENHQVWVPFHFLPGNLGKTVRYTHKGGFHQKLVCKPDSPISRDMLDMTIKDYKKAYSLHRLGIAMHVYADTFAHQGFAGIIHPVNEVYDLKLENEKLDWDDTLKYQIITKRFPMGHGAALECPDKPYLKWSYKNGIKGSKRVVRDNTEIFISAVQAMVGQLMRYRYELKMDIPNYNQTYEDKIRENFITFTDQDGEKRHHKWLDSIKNGNFSFGAVDLEYIPKGIGSWKYQAIGQKNKVDIFGEEFEYTEEFLSSNWKLFHDALQAHRFDVIHDILPRYGICVA